MKPSMFQTLRLEAYVAQVTRWPTEGRHVMAQFDPESVVVYQAFRHEIADYAVRNQRFGGPFGFGRMSWIKPNFLWMMYRSGWGTKEAQEHTLAVRISRKGFEEILSAAVSSTHEGSLFSTREEWQDAVKRSPVRLQWDPDHDPTGVPIPRRAIQLGLRDEMLRAYASEWIVEILDISPFVAEQITFVTGREIEKLLMPQEERYPLSPALSKCIQASSDDK